LRVLRQLRSEQKSKPRNAAREIFAPAVAKITRETVSVVNWIVRDAKRTPPTRDKIDSLERLKLLLYQVLNWWLGREDSNLRMAESKSAALPLGYAPSGASVAAAARGP
jgi:hypothetical protein